MALNIYIASIKKKKIQSSPLPQRLRHFGQHLSRVHLFLLLHKYALYIYLKKKQKNFKNTKHCSFKQYKFRESALCYLQKKLNFFWIENIKRMDTSVTS